LRQLAAVLGLLGQAHDAVRRSGLRGSGAAGAAGDALDDDAIERRIASRAAAKKAKQYGEADAIRAELAGAGIVLEDTPAGTVWRRG
jgi:cysteinyl-tRNA synthetase